MNKKMDLQEAMEIVDSLADAGISNEVDRLESESIPADTRRAVYENMKTAIDMVWEAVNIVNESDLVTVSSREVETIG